MNALKHFCCKRFLTTLFLIFAMATMFACTGSHSYVSEAERKKQSDALRNLGEAHMLSGNYTAALIKLLKAKELNPNSPYIYDDLGLVYIAKGRPDLAIQNFEKALEIKPDYTPALNNLGTAYLAQQEWDTAISIFKKINKDLLYATPYMPLSNIGWAYYNKKRYNLAKKYYLDALKMEPKFVPALRGLGLTYIALGDYSQAIKTLEKGAKLAPSLPETFLALGDAYKKARDYKNALTNYHKVIELAEEDSLAANEAGRKIREIK